MRIVGCREAACRQRADMTAELDPSLPDIMKPSEALAAHRVEIRDIVLSHRVINPRVFGSVARGLDTIDSDLDILVDTTPETTLFDLGAIRYKLRQLLGVQVDVLTPAALPEKFRLKVIAEARTL